MKKLRLDELTVKSFVTKLLPDGAMTIHGAADGDESNDIYCLSKQICTVVVVPPKPPPTPYCNRSVDGFC